MSPPLIMTGRSRAPAEHGGETASPAEQAAAEWAPGSPSADKNCKLLGRMPGSTCFAYAEFSPGWARRTNSCAIVQFLEKDNFLPNKRRKEVPL